MHSHRHNEGSGLAIFTNPPQRGLEILVPALLGFHGNEVPLMIVLSARAAKNSHVISDEFNGRLAKSISSENSVVILDSAFLASALRHIATCRPYAQSAIVFSFIRTLAWALGMHEATLAADLGIRYGSSERIPQASSERVIGLMSLIGRVEEITIRNGATGFDPAKWLGTWLNTPLPALGGARPGTYLDTMAGQDLLSSMIAIAESGAYA